MSTPELACPVCKQAVYKSPTSHSSYYKVKSNGEIKEAQIDLDGDRYHKRCARCSSCNCYLLPENFKRDSNLVLYCSSHLPSVLGESNTLAAGESVEDATDVPQIVNPEVPEVQTTESIDAPNTTRALNDESMEMVSDFQQVYVNNAEKETTETNTIQVPTDKPVKEAEAEIADLPQIDVTIEKEQDNANTPEDTTSSNEAVSGEFIKESESIPPNEMTEAAVQNVSEKDAGTSNPSAEVATELDSGNEPMVSSVNSKKELTNTEEQPLSEEKGDVMPDSVDPIENVTTAVEAAPIESVTTTAESLSIENATAAVEAVTTEESIPEKAAIKPQDQQVGQTTAPEALDDIDVAIVPPSVMTEESKKSALGDNIVDKMTSMADEYTKNGAYEAAEQMYTKCLGTRKTKLGEDHPETLTNRLKLGYLYFKWNKFAKADQMFSRVYEIKKEKYGESHEITLEAMGHLANFYAKPEVKNYKKAEELYLALLELLKQKYGEDSDETEKVMDQIANLYNVQDNKDKATMYLEKCVEMKTKKYGTIQTDGAETAKSGNDHVLKSIIKLAENYYGSKRYDKCESLFRQIYETKLSKLGESNDETMKYMLQLADVYKAQRKYDLASPLYESHLDLQVNKLGETNNASLESMSFLIGYYAMSDNNIFEKCEAMHLRKYRILQEMNGDEHKNTISAKVDIISFYKLHKKNDQLDEFYMSLLATYRKKFGESDTSKTLPLCEEIAAWYNSLDMRREAERAYREIYDKKRTKLGDVHVSTLRSLQDLIDFYELREQPAEVEKWTLQGYMLRWDKLGENHDDTLKAMLNLATLYQRRKKWPEGEKTFIKYVALVKGKFGASTSEAQAAEKAYADFKAEKNADSPPGCSCIIA